MNILWIVLIVGHLSNLALCQGQPKYSLQNMPHTSFSCRDKILGGYYADPETNCQMFHICVKVAGVGIQDFRFLCPNGTAFDQEAQICADWGDVDCEAATIFYGADNFDLYRIGTNFESKKSNRADEDESIFHLQHAESSDARRSKQYVSNQNSIQNQPRPTTTVKTTTFRTTQRTTPYTFPTTTSTTTSTTVRPTSTSAPRSYFESSTTREFVSTYKPTLHPKHFIDDKAVISTYRPKNANDYFNRAKASSNDDEIFKQSQSSHFYNNKNNGKEDFEDEFVKATKSPAKQKVRGRQRGRSKFRNSNNVNAVTSAPVRNNNFQTPTTSTQRVPFEQNTRTTFTNTPIVVQPIVNQRQNVTQLQASNNYQSSQSRQTTTYSSTNAPNLVRTTDETFFDVPKIKQKVQTTKLKSASSPLNVVPLAPSTTTTSSTFAPQPAVPQFNYNSFPQNNFGAIPQRVIIPSQLSPEQRLALQASNGNLNNFQTTVTTTQTPSTTTPVTPQQFNRANQLGNSQNEQKTKVSQQKFNFKTQKYEFIEPQNPTTQFYNPKYETKGSDQSGIENINLEPTRSNFVKLHNKTYASRQTTTGFDENKPTTFNPQQYYQSDQYQNLSPRGFSLAAQQQQQQKKTPSPEIRPQITSRSESRNHKKFSTLVPKENYNFPTTFKPETYSKKHVDTKIEKISNPNKYYSQIITNAPTVGTTTTTTLAPIPQQYNNNNNQFNSQTTTSRYANYFSTSTTPRPLGIGEEDDGLYRPDLYEKDLFKNKARLPTRTSVPSSTPVKNTLVPSSTPVKNTLVPSSTPVKNYSVSSSIPVKNTSVPSSTPVRNTPSSILVKNTLFQFYQTSTTLAPSVRNYIQNSDEDEFLKTEHSQNIFASGNQLRAEKEKEKIFGKTYEQYSETSSPRPFSKPTLPPTTTQYTTTTFKTTTRTIPKSSSSAKPKVDKDVSYDYQYYDTNGDHEYPEVEAIEDFGRTVKKSSTSN
ncbi:unnamed protein product [Chironomus riparius]|uniref:Chitin-binding type-2 domain-containing protein n=1 Tax=Chironomus riparius TaxID=315576 RepID=A0A9N9S1T1_9DIPT|nr:unnamed protein product [Chironomus riparius]